MAEDDKVRGARISLRAKPAPANDTGIAPSATPTLGELVDMLSAEYPDRSWPCDPALRDVRITSVIVRGR